MWNRPVEVAERILTSSRKMVDTPQVLVVGVGFKKGQILTTNAPGVSLLNALHARGAVVVFADPIVPQHALPHIQRLDLSTCWNKEYLERNFDFIVVAVKQNGLDYRILEELWVPVEYFCP